ncbi:MAG TPA: aldehyde dehydrogenase family protein, partial [Vicinamibacteria bacterium]|nr:aldehyde dehydrogenase family protein [Vicinamibacteria bacterium]
MNVVNPATGDVMGEVPEAGAADVARQLERAREAQPSWAERGFIERAAAVRRFRELLVERADSLARTLTSEVGKPITQARNEVKGTLARIDFFL